MNGDRYLRIAKEDAASWLQIARILGLAGVVLSIFATSRANADDAYAWNASSSGFCKSGSLVASIYGETR